MKKEKKKKDSMEDYDNSRFNFEVPEPLLKRREETAQRGWMTSTCFTEVKDACPPEAVGDSLNSVCFIHSIRTRALSHGIRLIQTDRQTDRETDTHADRQTDRQTETDGKAQRERHTDRKKEKDRQTGREVDRPTDTQTDRHKQAGRKTIGQSAH